jgi:predicted RNA binding protein YcfA (HicA-like mRNA interferase family)
MNLSAKYLIKILLQNGFFFKRAKGSHQLFYNPTTNKTVIVPMHGGKDLKKGTFMAIIKQAGIDKKDWE